MLCAQLRIEVVEARGIASRPGKACNKTEFDRIPGDEEHYRNRCSRSLGRDCCRDRVCDDHRRLTAHKLRRHLRQSIVLTLGPAVLDRHVAAIDITGFGQTPAEYDCP